MKKLSSSTRALGLVCGLAWPPTLGGWVAGGVGGCSFFLPAVVLLVAPGLAEGLHAVRAVVGPVALPASVYLVLALVLRGAGSPLGTYWLRGGDVFSSRDFLLLVSHLGEGGHRLHQVCWMHLWSNGRPRGGS